MKTYISLVGKRKLLLFVTLAIAASAISLVSFFRPILIGSIIDFATDSRSLNIRLVGILGGVLVLGMLVQLIGGILFEKEKLAVAEDIRTRLFVSYMFTRQAEVEQRGVGSFLTSLNQEVNNALAILSPEIFKGFVFLIRMVAALVVVFTWSWVFGLVFVLNIVTYLFSALVVRREVAPIVRRVSTLLPRYDNLVVRAMSQIRSARLFGKVPYYLRRHGTLQRVRRDLMLLRLVRTEVPTFFLVDLVNIASTVFLLAYGLLLVVRNGSTIGTVIAVMEYFRFVVDPIDLFTQLYSTYLQASRFAHGLAGKLSLSIDEANQLTSEITSSRGNTTEENLTFGPYPTVEFMSVSVRDDNTGDSLLRNVSVGFRPNQVTVLVGASGSGKSKLIQLLLGDQDNYDGEICVDGTDWHTISHQRRWRLVGYCSASPTTDIGTLQQNIVLGMNEHDLDSQITKLLSLHHLDHRCFAFASTDISKGELARVGIARVLHANRPINVFDEPLDGVHPSLKYRIACETFDRLRDRTCIVVTHDIQLIKEIADRVLVMENGTIVADVSAEDALQRRSPEFQKVFQLGGNDHIVQTAAPRN